MLSIEAYRGASGMHLHVRAVCTGVLHTGDLCETRSVRTLCPTARVEGLGLIRALEETVQDVWVQYPDLLELAEH